METYSKPTGYALAHYLSLPECQDALLLFLFVHVILVHTRADTLKMRWWQQSSSCRLCSPLMTSSPAALATGTGSPAQEAGSGSEAGTLPHHCFQTYQQGGHAIYRMQSFPPVC
jgi:hypothetical protein